MLRVALIVSALLQFVGIAHAQVSLPPSVRDLDYRGKWHGESLLLSQIDAACTMLAREEAGFTLKTTPRKVIIVFSKKSKKTAKRKWKKRWLPATTALAEFNVALAVMHIEHKKIEIVRVSSTRRMPDGYTVDWRKVNGMNTHFLVDKPEGYAVLCIKRVLNIGGKYEEYLYTPYSWELDNASMREVGMDYLLMTFEEGKRRLRSLGVMSRTRPNTLVADLVPSDVALVLSIIEHIEPSRSEKEPIAQLINEVLVTVAANRQESYKYSVSRGAGARGLHQFIGGTYQAIRRRYAKANLIPDFVAGMNDHVNAAAASLLLFDSDIGGLPKAEREKLLADKKWTAKYLSIAYNGGSRRAVCAWNKRDDPKKELACLPAETRNYVFKLEKSAEALGM